MYGLAMVTLISNSITLLQWLSIFSTRQLLFVSIVTVSRGQGALAFLIAPFSPNANRHRPSKLLLRRPRHQYHHRSAPTLSTAFFRQGSASLTGRQSWCCSRAFAKTGPVEEVIQNKDNCIALTLTMDTKEGDSVEKQDASLLELLSFVDALVSKEEAFKAADDDDATIIQRIESLALADLKTAQESCLVLEQRHQLMKVSESLPSYEWIYAASPGNQRNLQQEAHHHAACSYPLAVRSTGEPLLSTQAVAHVRMAAEQIWALSSTSSSSSRFTYQYPGNSEAHVSDFAQVPTDTIGTKAVKALNEALQNKIYPLIRHVFLSDMENDHHNNNSTQLFVYDALVIRYNSTAAAAAAATDSCGGARAAAGQPLHRDLGLVSVNIMLNNLEEFEGGGTFFENQLLHSFNNNNNTVNEVDIQPLKPLGVGHGLLHAASERHAGAGTTQGVRDILVLFVAAQPSTMMQAARLKQSRAHCVQRHPQDPPAALLCRIRHQRLALQVSRGRDGEAFQYLGTALMEYADLLWQSSTENEHKKIDFCSACWQAALQCYQHASTLTPCDARIYNNQAIVLGKLHEILSSSSSNSSVPQQQQYQQQYQRELAYRSGIELLRQSQRAGCNVNQDYELLSLNYGLFLANQDRLAEASNILEEIVHAGGAATDEEAGARTTTRSKAHRLWKWCQEQLL